MPDDCLPSLTLTYISPTACAQDKTRIFRGPTNQPPVPPNVNRPARLERGHLGIQPSPSRQGRSRQCSPLKDPRNSQGKGRAIRCGPTQRHSFSCCGGGLAAGLLKLVLWSLKVPVRRFSHGGKRLSFFSSLVTETRLSVSAIEPPWARLFLREPIPSTAQPVRPSVLRPAQWYKDPRPRCPK